MSEESSFTPNKNLIRQNYNLYKNLLAKILGNIEKKVKSCIKLISVPTYKSRVKSFDSYYKKILKNKSKELNQKEFITLTDLIGIRVICPFLEDLQTVQKIIENNFDVQEVEIKGANQSFREFGYESVHVLIKIPEDCVPENNTLSVPESLLCEIQIRTILQDAWAEVEHELIYKAEFNPFDKPLRRKLASINASLCLADTIFQEIRDYQNKLQQELSTRRNTFYEKVDQLSTDKNFTKETKNDLYSELNFGNSESIDDLILKALHEHNQGNLKAAIQIYSKILDAKDELDKTVISVVYKHRGMANFANNNYDDAISDFNKCLKLDSKAFKAYYYLGIVYAIRNQHKTALEYYNKSLQLGPFQSHVYYRRALSYFYLGNYENAMKDVGNAENLGLVDDDLKRLKNELLKKFKIDF